jgi:hypothetical protein
MGRAASYRGRLGLKHSRTMSRKRIQKSLVVFAVIGLIVLAGTELFVVRDLLAALLLFCVLLGVLGIAVLASFLFGKGSCIALTCS